MNKDHIISLRKTPAAAPVAAAEPPLPRKKPKGRMLFVIACSVLAVAVLTAAGLWIARGRLAAGTAAAVQTPGDVQSVVDRVGKLMLLPDEVPTLAIVSDLEKLKGQEFFAHAQVNDVVLMYAKAQKAVLYSPSLNKVIEVAPITNDTQQ